MNSIFVYCEITEGSSVAPVSLELLTKGRSLADRTTAVVRTLKKSEGIDVYDNGISYNPFRIGDV